jgi:bile acid:Na+ symporter, BASS family
LTPDEPQELVMQNADGRTPALARLAEFLRRWCFWLLVGCYAAAALCPTPGRSMRLWQWSLPGIAHADLTLPLLLLALLLFCAALQTNLAQIRSLGARPWALLLATFLVWLAPALLVLVAGATVPALVDEKAAAGLLVGLALVASMPVANSSVGWTQLARGNLAIGLALVLVTIFVCPWVTPRVLGLLQSTLSQPDRTAFQTLIDNFSGTFFIVWVILPTVAGLACRYALGEERVAATASLVKVASVASLLLLNYVNAALALPEVIGQSSPVLLLTTVVLAAAISAIGLAAGWMLSVLMRLEPDIRSALMFGLGMKHTGLALLLAGAALAEERVAILIIVLATLAQHVLAGLIEWRLQPPPS